MPVRGAIPCVMPSIAEFFLGHYGPQLLGAVFLRSRVMTATTIFAVMDRLKVYTDAEESKGNLTIPPGVGIYDMRTQAEITREQLLEMHSYQLRFIAVTGHGSGIQFGAPGPVQLLGDGSMGPSTLGGDIAEIVRSTSRPRVIWRRLWAFAPWLLVVASVVVLLSSIGSASKVEVSALGLLVALAVVVSWTASVLVFREVRNYMPPTIVRPYRWRDVVARRITTWLTIGGALVGAAAGAVLTWVLTRP